MTDAEITLVGGRVTPGVVRIGSTVRRPPTANSDFVRQLLAHLAARGFDGAPRWLGIDTCGRDMFSYVEGDVPADLAQHDDATLDTAARLIRHYHDLTVDLVLPEARATGAVICHNDLSPCNFVFRAGVPVAMIDFDTAAPGLRLHDLGYAAWLWLDLGAPEIAAAEQHRRLGTFAAGYGTGDLDRLWTAIEQRQMVLVSESGRIGDAAMARWAADCLAWTRCHAPQ